MTELEETIKKVCHMVNSPVDTKQGYYFFMRITGLYTTILPHLTPKGMEALDTFLRSEPEMAPIMGDIKKWRDRRVKK